MAIGSLGVNGLRGHIDDVELLLNDLGILMLNLNETMLDKIFPKELSDIMDYQQFRLDRTCSSGRVLLYIRDSFTQSQT